MPRHAFTLILDQDPAPFLEQLQKAGCQDATFSVDHGVPLAHFSREAPTLQRAIALAARDICTTELDVVGVAEVAHPEEGNREV